MQRVKRRGKKNGKGELRACIPFSLRWSPLQPGVHTPAWCGLCHQAPAGIPAVCPASVNKVIQGIKGVLWPGSCTFPMGLQVATRERKEGPERGEGTSLSSSSSRLFVFPFGAILISFRDFSKKVIMVMNTKAPTLSKPFFCSSHSKHITCIFCLFIFHKSLWSWVQLRLSGKWGLNPGLSHTEALNHSPCCANDLVLGVLRSLLLPPSQMRMTPELLTACVGHWSKPLCVLSHLKLIPTLRKSCSCSHFWYSVFQTEKRRHREAK